MRKAGGVLVALLCLALPSDGQAMTKEIKIVIPPALEVQLLQGKAAEFDGMTISKESTLGVRANTPWSLRGKADSDLVSQPEIYLDGTSDETSGPANRSDAYQEVELLQVQDLSWQDPYGFHRFLVTIEITPTI